jgi:hypothetical protein
MTAGAIAVVAALGSACGFAVSTSLQHRAASGPAASGLRLGHLLRILAQRPSWLIGLVTGALALVLHAVAVGHGALIVVQPLVVTGIVLALPVRAALDHRLPSVSDMTWVVVTVTGIALFVVSSNPTSADRRPIAVHGLGIVGVGVLAIMALSRAGLRATSARGRGLLLGGAAGVLFGLTAGTLKLLVLGTASRSTELVWLVTLVGLGVWGLALNQRTYQIAPLSISMPVLNVVDVLVAIAFGYLVFGEVPAHQPMSLVVEGCGMALMGTGLSQLMAHAGQPDPAAPKRPPLAALVEVGRVS